MSLIKLISFGVNIHYITKSRKAIEDMALLSLNILPATPGSPGSRQTSFRMFLEPSSLSLYTDCSLGSHMSFVSLLRCDSSERAPCPSPYNSPPHPSTLTPYSSASFSMFSPLSP